MSKSLRISLLAVMVVLVLSLSACNSDAVSMYTLPIGWEGGWLPVQWLVTQVAELLVWISNLAGGYYWVGLIVLTLLVRTLGWPIYAKSNQTTANMQLAQPELTKLQEKYKGRNDEVSQRKMQAEQMEIYKKYGINPLGCLLPFLQMPIFIAMYQVVRRVPLSKGMAEGIADYSDLKYNFLWIKDLGGPDPYYILPILVGLLMLGYQLYSMKKPEYLQNKKFDKTDQQRQSESTMKMMSYFMVIMLVYIALSNAGIALYWIIGNSYQFLQTYLNRKQSYKKYLALKEQ
jgi:YidC/Oxa1 family membrane protein insertase